MRRKIFPLSLVTALVALVAWLWPISREPLIRVMDQDDKQGYINADGRIAVDFTWDSVSKIDAHGWIPVRNDKGLWGWVDRRGEVMVAPRWEGRWGQLDPFADEIIIPEFDAEGMAIVEVDRKVGWCDRTGDLVIPTVWDEARPFGSEGLAVVSRKEKMGCINRKGEMVIPCEFLEIYPFDEFGMTLVQKDKEKFGWVNVLGEFVIPCQWQYAHPFGKGGRAPVGNFVPIDSNTSVLQWGLIDRKGEWVVEPNWNSMRAFDSAGFAAVSIDGRWGWVDADGTLVLVDGEWQDDVGEFDSEGMAGFRSGTKWGMARTDGSVAIPLGAVGERSLLDPFNPVDPLRSRKFDSEGWMRISDGDGVRWIDRSGEIMLESEWPFAGDFDQNGRAEVFGSDMGFLGWMGRDGKLMGEFPGFLWRPRDGEQESKDYYVACREVDPFAPALEINSFEKLLYDLGIDWSPESCRCYYKDGTLIWSNGWMRFETKCQFTLGCALIFAFFTRPKRKGTK